MGKRYQAILRYLGKPYACLDVDTTENEAENLKARATAFIVATPTSTHLPILYDLANYRKPILCEKPVCTSLDDLDEWLAAVSDEGLPFRCMLQYTELGIPKDCGPTYYDYFRSGPDGLVWDCLQIVGHATDPYNVRLNNESPIWKCAINGKVLSLHDMDAAYVAHVLRWFQDPKQRGRQIFDVHEKTAAYLDRHVSGGVQ